MRIPRYPLRIELAEKEIVVEVGRVLGERVLLRKLPRPLGAWAGVLRL